MSSVITIVSVVEADITISGREILRFSVFITIFSPIGNVVIRLSHQIQRNDARRNWNDVPLMTLFPFRIIFKKREIARETANKPSNIDEKISLSRL